MEFRERLQMKEKRLNNFIPFAFILLLLPFIGFQIPVKQENILSLAINNKIQIIILCILTILFYILAMRMKKTPIFFTKALNYIIYLLYLVNAVVLVINNYSISNMKLFDRILWSLGFLCSIKFIYDGINMLLLVQLRTSKVKVNTDQDTFRLVSKNCGLKSVLCGIILIFTIILTGNKIYSAVIVLIRQFLCELAWEVGVKKS